MRKRNKLIGTFLFIMLFLTGCSNVHQIKNTLYISSVAIEKKEERFVLYLYYITSRDVGKNDNMEDNSFGLIKSEDESLINAFNKCERGIPQVINYSTIKTFVLHKSFLGKDNLEDFNTIFKKTANITFNFYLFYTEEEIEKIYTSQNPDKISSLFNIFSNPKLNYHIDNNAQPLHLLEYIRNYYLDFLAIKIPQIGHADVNLSENEENKQTTVVTGVCYYKNKTVCFGQEEYPEFKIIFNQQSLIINLKDVDVHLNDYKYKLKFKDNKFLIDIKYELNIVGNKKGLSKEEILEKINHYLKLKIEYIVHLSNKNEIDFLNLNYELYKSKKNLINKYDYYGFEYKIVNKNY